tara:strand:- start:1206 stop:1442 length:237 start_codon:yes stop_codon:yes gene_type:complete
MMLRDVDCDGSEGRPVASGCIFLGGRRSGEADGTPRGVASCVAAGGSGLGFGVSSVGPWAQALQEITVTAMIALVRET